MNPYFSQETEPLFFENGWKYRIIDFSSLHINDKICLVDVASSLRATFIDKHQIAVEGCL